MTVCFSTVWSQHASRTSFSSEPTARGNDQFLADSEHAVSALEQLSSRGGQRPLFLRVSPDRTVQGPGAFTGLQRDVFTPSCLGHPVPHLPAVHGDDCS